MRLSELIRADTERIIREWEEFAKTLSAGVSLPRWLLRVHASAILQSIAHDIETPKFPVKQEAKGEGSPGPSSMSQQLTSICESNRDLIWSK
jgi:hypothetical protein